MTVRELSLAELVSTALVGTDRLGADPARLLDRAAMLTIAHRAGRRPTSSTALPVSPMDDRPAVREEAGHRLAALLAGEHARMLPEWLAAAARGGRLAPPYLLPELLERGRADSSLRADIGLVAGLRGRWLAALNADWAYLLQEGTGREDWEHGSRGDRLAYLTALRTADRDAARDLLAQTWDLDAAPERAAFLTVLGDGLSAADEPFLESVLDDRGRDVRQRAADLLTRLPDSRLGRRMARRAIALVTVEHRPLRAPRLVTTPPIAADPAMERDGVRVHATDRRADLLEQVIARTPLVTWIGHLGRTPEEIVNMEAGEWRSVLHAGWVRGAILQRDPGWARALIPTQPSGDLLAVLDPSERMPYGGRLVAQTPLGPDLLNLIGAIPAPWTGSLAAAVLTKIEDAAGSWHRHELERRAARCLDPAYHADVEPGELAAALRFRYDMLKELE